MRRSFYHLASVTLVPVSFWFAQPIAAMQVQSAVKPAALSVAGDARGTSLLELPARLHVENVSLKDALLRLKEATGIPLGFSPTLVSDAPHVTCHCENLTVGDAMAVLLRGTSFEMVPRAKHLVIREAMAAIHGVVTLDVSPEPGEVLEFFKDELPPTRTSREGTIQGRVVEARTLQPIAAASVRIPDLNLGALSGADGRFTIRDVPSGEHTVEVSRIAYRSSSRTVMVASGETAELTFELTVEALVLDGVVVTGTAGRVERRAQGAVIASVDATDVLRKAPITELADVLQGRVPGVSLTQASGVSGVGQQIRIRGAASISISNEPLVYIDGVRADSRLGSSDVSRLSDLNPNDIESIEVVKGPAAATLYGADASAGVIQIITKKGSVGTGFRQTVEMQVHRLEPAFTSYYNYARCDAAEISNPNIALCQGVTPGTVIVDDPAGRYGVMRTGHVRSGSWSMEGGGERYRTFSSLSWYDELGNLPNNEYGRISARMNYNFFPTEELEIGVNLGVMRTQADLPTVGGSGFGFTIAMMAGTPLTVGGPLDGMRQPFLNFDALSAIETRETVTRVIPDLQIRYSPTSWFTNRLVLGADGSRAERMQFYPRNDIGYYQRGRDDGEISEWRTGFTRFTINYLGTFSREHRRDWASTLSLGTEILTETEDEVFAYGLGLTTNAARAVSSAAEVTGNQVRFEDRRVGFFTQWEPSHADRLYFQFGVRADKFAAFGTDADWFLSPSARVSYVASEDPRIDRVLPDFLSSLRVRSAFGTTGRAPQSGAALTTYLSAPFLRADGRVGSGILPLNPGNPSLRAEKGQELEVGFDAALLDDRLAVEYTYFHKITRDLILQVPQPPSLGFQAFPYANIGRVRNAGHELALRAQLVSSPRFGWDVALGLNTLDNEVVDLGGTAPFWSLRFEGANRVAEGYPLGAYFTHRIIGFDVANDRAIVSDSVEFVGNLLPGHEGNLSTNLRLPWNIHLYAHFDWKRDVHLYSRTLDTRDGRYLNSWYWAHRDELPAEERLRRFGPYFTADGTRIDRDMVKEPYIEPAGFVRLNEVSFTYDLPEALVSRRGVHRAAVQLGIRNIRTWTRYTGLDPDVQGEFSALAGRADFMDFPSGRRWTLRVVGSF
jgi:TonB-dependent starch-binding outer membrane protein SusC